MSQMMFTWLVVMTTLPLLIFASHFNKVYMCNVSTDKDDIEILFDGYSGKQQNEYVEVVDNCLRRLKLGKACGPERLSAEHLYFSYYYHLILVTHLWNLFRSKLLTGLVPDGFGYGIVIPLPEDKIGDVNSLDNYRGSTLIPAVAKLFEGVLLDNWNEFVCSNESVWAAHMYRFVER
jgi:hypothetical protein